MERMLAALRLRGLSVADVFSVLKLAKTRDNADRRNLFDAYLPGKRATFIPEGAAPPATAGVFRQTDGAWTDPDRPTAGAAFTLFGRNTDPARTPTDYEASPNLCAATAVSRRRRGPPWACCSKTAADGRAPRRRGGDERAHAEAPAQRRGHDVFGAPRQSAPGGVLRLLATKGPSVGEVAAIPGYTQQTSLTRAPPPDRRPAAQPART